MRRWSLATTKRRISIGRYRVPQPRNGDGGCGPRVCIGSDGCVGRPCRRSAQAVRRVRRVGAHRGRTRCRCRPAAGRRSQRRPRLIETIATGGDDYEILCRDPRRTSCRHFASRRAVAAVSGHRDRRDRGRPRAAAGDRRGRCSADIRTQVVQSFLNARYGEPGEHVHA